MPLLPTRVLSRPIPALVPVRQSFPFRRLDDVSRQCYEIVLEQLQRSTIHVGARVGLGVGSRGIGDLEAIVSACVRAYRDGGMTVELVPAIGSHGGGTASGHVQVLAGLGVTPESVGAPIQSSMDVATIGTAGDGVPVMVDRTLSS